MTQTVLSPKAQRYAQLCDNYESCKKDYLDKVEKLKHIDPLGNDFSDVMLSVKTAFIFFQATAAKKQEMSEGLGVEQLNEVGL